MFYFSGSNYLNSLKSLPYFFKDEFSKRRSARKVSMTRLQLGLVPPANLTSLEWSEAHPELVIIPKPQIKSGPHAPLNAIFFRTFCYPLITTPRSQTILDFQQLFFPLFIYSDTRLIKDIETLFIVYYKRRRMLILD